MWTNFEQSPIEDETISNVFSSRGIYRITSDEKVKQYPDVRASIQNQKMVLAIDSTLLLLEDELVCKCIVLTFDSHIDCINITAGGNLIICCLSNGEVHGVTIRGCLLFSPSIKREDVHPLGGRTFAAIQSLDNQYKVVCTNGSLYGFSHIDQGLLEKCLDVTLNESGLEAIPMSAFNDLKLTRLYHMKDMQQISTALLLKSSSSSSAEDIDENEMQLIAGTRNLLIQSSPTANSMIRVQLPSFYQGIKHIYQVDCDILILSNSGHLLQYCSITNLIMLSCKQPSDLLIDDLIIMDSNEQHIELLILTKSNNDNERSFLMIDYPSFKCINELEVSYHCWLVQQPKSSLNLYYISGQECNDDNSLPTILELMLVSETHPSERFKKLITKGYLDEAEDFGKQFELCLQPIYEARAKRILMKMDSLPKEDIKLAEEQFSILMELFEKIENRNFFRSIRMLSTPSRKMLEKYLKAILLHLDEEADEDHIIEIIEQLDRLKTISICDPYELNGDWSEFVQHPNLIKYLITLFKSDIPLACLIWKRHAATIISKVSENDLQKLLTLIPNNTKPFHLLQWLREFIPVVSNSHPYMVPYTTEWCIQATRSMQHSEHWPEIGLEFSTKVLEIFEEIQFMYTDLRRQHERNINKLKDLVNALQDLFVLKKSYNLTFTLDNYLQDSLDDTTKCILLRVHLDDLKSLVNNFLYPIYQEKGKSPVGAIRRYISYLVASRKSFSCWLERSVACIDLLHHEDDRLESAFLVLQNAPVPWPEIVTPLLKLRFSTHPLALKINTEYEIQVIKIMKVKYGWNSDSGANLNLNLLMFRILKMDKDDMLEDIRLLTKAAPEIATAVNFNCCHHLVCKGKIQLAYDFFKSIKTNEIKQLMTTQIQSQADNVVELFAQILENAPLAAAVTEKSYNEQQNILEFLKLITPATCPIASKRYKYIENRLILFHKYNVRIDGIDDLLVRSNCLRFLDMGIETIIAQSRDVENIYGYFITQIAGLCKVLNLTKVEGVKRLSRRLNCLMLSCALAYSLLDVIDCNPTTKDDYIEMALLLIGQQIQTVRNAKEKNLFESFNDKDPLALPLAYELLSRAQINEHHQLLELTELMNYVRVAKTWYNNDAIVDFYQRQHQQQITQLIAKALDAAEVCIGDNIINYSIDNSFDMNDRSSKTKKRYSVSIFDVDDSTQMQKFTQMKQCDYLYIVKFISNTLLFVIMETIPTNCLLLNLKSILSNDAKKENCIDNNEINIDSVREEFFLSLEHLIKTKKHTVWYTIIQYLINYQKIHKCRLVNNDFISMQMCRVLKNEMTNKDVNFIDLFVMLTADQNSPAILEKLTNEMKSDQQKVNLLTLAEMYYTHYDEMSQVESIRMKRIKHYYYMEFCKREPSIRGKFNSDWDSIDLLLQEFRSKQMDMNLLLRISNDFNLDYQKLLVTQLISILQAQEMQFECKTDAFGDEELVMITTEQEIRNLCQPYINEIKNTELLVSKLKLFIDEIHIYFYELYLCVIDILKYLDAMPKGLDIWNSILHFLKHKMIKRRRNRAGQLETDLWFQSQKDNSVLPKIARYRLPFKPIVEHPLKDILDTELNVDNCEGWFPLIQLHTMLKGSKDAAINCDYFCMSAVKNSITNYKMNESVDTWHLQPTNNAFLKSILRLIKHINSASKAFMILYFVSSYAPDGADQVEATYECYKFIMANESSITDAKCFDQMNKIKRKYPILKTQHLLHIYGLTDENLLRLIDNPTELICELYHHEIILKGGKLDINAVVMEIGELHNLNLEPIQFKLLQKWLAFNFDTAENTVLDETIFEDQQLAENSIEDASTAAENVIRANYIINSWPKEMAVQFLIAHIFPPDGTVNTSKQLQMYECYFKLYDGSSNFENLLSQQQYITMKCVHELKKLGYNSSLEKFNETNKIDILKLVWQRNSNNPHTLPILANICLGFNIYIDKIWNGILKRMVGLNMLRELNALIEVLSCKAKLLHIEGLAMAWEYVLLQPFKNAQQMRSFEQEDILCKTLCRLQNCPVVHSLNLIKFASNCTRLERPHMAAMLLAFCRNDDERREIKKLINERNDKLRQDIIKLEEAGILPLILNFALKELEL